MADLPKEPVTRQEEYLSRLAGENTTLPIEPLTREEMYLEGAIGRVEAVEEEVEEIKNNPDVVDIVDTYADLQAYDTQHLTNNDIIRVLQDETHSGNSAYYRFTKNPDTWTFIGEISGGTGSVTKLTSADYDYPDANPTGVALWRKETGLYEWENGVHVFMSTSYDTNTSGAALVSGNQDTSFTDTIHIRSSGGENSYVWIKTIRSTGVAQTISGRPESYFLTEAKMVQSTGDSSVKVMSQNAVTSMVFNDPSTKRQIEIGDSADSRGVDSIAIGYKASPSTNTCSIAIGSNAAVSSQYSTAIGYQAKATRQGEFNIGSGLYPAYGYNGTPYRVLGGVHDPIDAHDAATKGYVDANAGGPFTVLDANVSQDWIYHDEGEDVDYIAAWKLPAGKYTLAEDSSIGILINLDLIDEGDQIYSVGDTFFANQQPVLVVSGPATQDTLADIVVVFTVGYVQYTVDVDGLLVDFFNPDNSFEGTDGASDGRQGLVPAPSTDDVDKFLKSDGSWATPGATIMYLAYFPGEDPATPGESCLYADAGLTTKLTGGDFWNILVSGNPVVLRYRDTTYNEFHTFSFLRSHLPEENTAAGFDSYAPEAYFYNLPNQTIYVNFGVGDPDETDGFLIDVQTN